MCGVCKWKYGLYICDVYINVCDVCVCVVVYLYLFICDVYIDVCDVCAYVCTSDIPICYTKKWPC